MDELDSLAIADLRRRAKEIRAMGNEVSDALAKKLEQMAIEAEEFMAHAEKVQRRQKRRSP